jgi:hypothetical protein
MSARSDRASSLHPSALTHEGDVGRLTSPGAELPVSIAAKQGDTLMLTLLIKVEADLHALPEPVLLECTSSRGLVRFHGQAVLEQGDVIRFHVVDEPEVVQRRRFVRVLAPQPVSLSGAEGAFIGAHTVNVSGGGMLLSGADRLDVGDLLRFRLHLPGGELPVMGTARVVRATEGGQRAVVFESISDEARERLIHFIFDRLRAARARTRALET